MDPRLMKRREWSWKGERGEMLDVGGGWEESGASESPKVVGD